MQSSKDAWDRKSTCQMADAYLMELKTRDDAQRFLHLMFNFAKTSTSSFALGATAKVIGNSTIWVWDHSGDEIEVCTHGCLLKTSSDSVDVQPEVGRSLYFDPTHSPGSDDEYLEKLPYFDLYVRAAPESDATYFFCMKVLFSTELNKLKLNFFSQRTEKMLQQLLQGKTTFLSVSERFQQPSCITNDSL